MASGYSQRFTLSDIFCNPNLKGVFPQIRVKELATEQGVYAVTTRMETAMTLLFKYSKQGAKPFYKPMTATKKKYTIDIGGELIGDYKGAIDGVYNAINGNRYMLSMTLNNMNMIRYALKFDLDQKRTIGYDNKLFLRLGSLDEIKGMNKQQLGLLMDDIMRNLYYNREWQLVQKKFNVEKIPIEGVVGGYDKRQDNWLKKIWRAE